MSDTNWKLVAQEAEKVRDLALEAQHEAALARVAAEQERDGLHLLGESVARMAEELTVERDAARKWARLWKKAAKEGGRCWRQAGRGKEQARACAWWVRPCAARGRARGDVWRGQIFGKRVGACAKW